MGMKVYFGTGVMMAGLTGGVSAFVARSSPATSLSYFILLPALAVALALVPLLMHKNGNGR